MIQQPSRRNCVTLPGGLRYLPSPYSYLFQLTIPTALALVPNQVQSMDADADFWLHGILGIGTSITIRLQDADTYFLSNNLLPIQFFQNAATPAGFVLDDPIFFPAGSRIGIDAQDTSGQANNAFKIVFHGKKLLPVEN